jgi:RNA polymerase sigma factor (sigma-70 family)
LVDQALDWLSDRSLLTFSLDGQSVMMHRLVAQVVRHGLIRRRRLGAVCWVAASVLEAHAIAVAGSQDRSAVRRIPQQVTGLLDSTAELAEGADEELAEILLRLRFISLYHLIELGDSAHQAIVIGEPLIADLERLLGPGHPDTLNARNSLAAAYLAADRVADAIPLFELTLVVIQRQLGSDHPDTLTSQNNLASAYQDAGRVAEAIRLYELNLAERERLLGSDHPSTLTSRGNLAAAQLASGQGAEAIPLLEQTLASRERVLGPDHPDTQTSRRNLAKAYQDAGRTAEAIPLLEQGVAGRQRVLRPDGPAAKPVPPVEQTLAGRGSQAPANANVRPVGFRRPPADPAGRLPSDRIVGPNAKLPSRSSSGRKQDAPLNDAEHDREVVAAITAGDLTGIAAAYDRYAAAIYGYCHWMVHDSADAAESLQDAFVLAAATLSELPEHAKLRPWLFALAHNECRRRIRPGSATRDEADATNSLANGGQRAAETDHPVGEAADATVPFYAITEPVGAVGEAADMTVAFHAVSESADAIGEPADVTMLFPVVGQLADATMRFRVVSESADATDGLADVNGYLGQAELRALIRSILADMKPREREVIELSFRHDLNDNDLAIVFGVSFSRAHALASRTRSRLEKSFGALRTALAGRQACPVVGELLADWDGQLSEQTRDLVAWHTEQCQTCLNHAQGGLRPTVLSGLLPLVPLPPQLREKVLSHCSSTSEDALAYRRRVIRRADAKWAALFSQAIRRLSWDSVRANPGPAIAVTAVAMWVLAAVTVTLLAFAGFHAAHARAAQPTDSSATHAQAAQTTAGTSPSSPAAVQVTATAPTSAAARPSPAFTQPSVSVSSQVQSSPSRSSSPELSKSPSPKPSKSPSPSPSLSPSSSPTPSPTA